MYSPYIPLKVESKLTTKKSCKTCTFNDDGFCKLIQYHSYLHANYPKPACDENFSGWMETVTVQNTIKMIMLEWIMSVIAGIINIFNRTRPKMPSNELTKNELDD